MFKAETIVRVRYGETDQMGVVYYGNYALYYEVARVEAMRNLGMSYRELEENGIMMPVLELGCKFIKPARYDDELRIRVIIPELPITRLYFQYEVFNNSNNELLNTGHTTLVFIDKTTNRPCRCPADFYQRLARHFPENVSLK